MLPLVLLPGMMCDARLFAPQIAAFSGVRPVILAPISNRDNMRDLATDVLSIAPPRFALAGLSMGGIVAMEILRQAPDRIERIAFLDTNPCAEADDAKARRVPQMDAVRNGQLAAVMREEMKPNYLVDSPRKKKILDLCMDMALELGPDVFLRQSQALMTRPDQTQTLRAARLPTLALCGAQDELCPISRHELIASLVPDAVLSVVANAGHMPTLEQPDATNAALSRWLEA